MGALDNRHCLCNYINYKILLHGICNVINFRMKEPVNNNRGQIKTRMTRKLRLSQIGEMEVEHTFVDKPASLETWIDHCGKLSEEMGISALDVHRALFAVLPEIFGR